MAYKRVTKEERRLIHRWRQEALRPRDLGRRLGRSAVSISREIHRNSGRRGYRPKQAHALAQHRARRAGPRRFTLEVRVNAEKRLREGWTPEIISGRARLEGRAWVCKETIYKHVYADAKAGGNLWEHLPRSGRKRKRRCPRKEDRGRGRIPNQRRIDTRPAEVETRKTVGHWEGDLINGASKTGNLVTLVERSTRFTLIGRTDNKEAKEVTATVILGGFSLDTLTTHSNDDDIKQSKLNESLVRLEIPVGDTHLSVSLRTDDEQIHEIMIEGVYNL